jgi:pyruvate,water dikinase
VGCHDATKTIREGQILTVSCAEGDVGNVYEGKLPFEIKKITLDNMPELPFKIMMNVANPDRAFSFQSLPNAGIGLARLEFIISQLIGIHPQACLSFDEMDSAVKSRIMERIAGYANPTEFYVKKLSEGIATLAAAFAPQPVIVRFSDFKSNEYANLIGGTRFEPTEENPMIGFRGASRYISPTFQPCFALECQAIRHVREAMGLTNVEVMIPFVRTVSEAKKVIEIMAQNGLKRGEKGLKVIMMCELPSNALLADQFLEHFDGFSIGSNDLTQLTLGLDRDSGIVAGQFDERDDAVKMLMDLAITACKKQNKYIGICGQGPSDHPDLAQWLVEKGIDSVSLNPDTVLETWMFLAKKKAL